MESSHWRVVLGTLAAVTLIGCGGGGSTTPDGGGSAKTVQKAPLSGTVGDSTKSGRAVLKVDMDGDGRYDGKEDILLATEVKEGGFAFEKIEAPEEGTTHAQLIVTMDGYAPFQRSLVLGDSAMTVDASAALNKPLLKAAVNLGGLSSSARMDTVIQFGIQKSGSGHKAYSRLVSLSKLAAGDVPEIEGALSSYQFGATSFDENVTLLQADMQAFDSTDPKDIQAFPGSFRGYGENGEKSADSSEVGLQSAAFDRLVLTDQNGQDVTLVSDKMNATVDLSNCTNRWTRHLTPAQETVIQGWGDYDSNDTGYQVPIWSNDNSEMAWKFVGVANYDDEAHQFEMCIPDDWGSGYLNCDSPIAFTKPTTICINTFDQDNHPLSGLNLNGYTTPSGEYAYGTTNTNGHASLELSDNNISKWSFQYKGAVTGWQYVAISDTPVFVDTETCSYELNVTGIVDPFTAEVKVTVQKYNADTSIPNVNVTLRSQVYYGPHYLYRSGVTDANGSVTFMVEPGIAYVVTYSNGTANVNVNGTVEAPETADSGAYADVIVKEQNAAPTGYIYLTMSTVNKDFTSSIPVEFWANDGNGDTITVTSTKVDGLDVTLSGVSDSSSAGYFSRYGNLDISGLSVGIHEIKVVVSDGELSKTLAASFEVTGNRPPVIGELLNAMKYASADEFADSTDTYYIETNGTIIKAALYGFAANYHDPDGDAVTVVMTLDGASYDPAFDPLRTDIVNITDGSHVMLVSATDDKNATSSKIFYFVAGNQKPVITRAGTFSNPINLSLGATGTLYAYAEDPDEDGVSGVVMTSGSMTQTLNGSAGASYFWSDFNASALGVGEHNLTFVATDAVGAVSDVYRVTVKIINQNMPPEFYYGLYDQQIDLGETANYSEIAIMDPEGDRMTLSCTVDGTAQTLSPSTSGMADSYQMSISGLTEGTHAVACTATDSEGASTTETATVTVIDPTKEVPLVIKTDLPDIVVTVHDAAHNLKMVKTGTTDANGDVTLMLPAGTTTTAFSLAFDPSAVVSSDQVFADKKDETVMHAYNNCQWNQDLNISECTTADWCALLADEDSIPTWVIDAAQIKDKDDNNITGASVDTDANGEISKAEFYQAALRKADEDNSGDLTWAELDNKEVGVMAFVGVPVKTYEFKLANNDHSDNADGEWGLNCSQYPTFDINVTNASAYVDSVQVYGSGYGYGYANGANSFGTKVTSYMKDVNGKYDYTVQFYDDQYELVAIDLLLDKSAADMSGGKSYDATTLSQPVLMDVNFTNDVAMTSLSIDARYHGISNLGYSQSLGNSAYKYFYDSRLHYAISGSRYLGTSTMEKYYEHSDYYGDGTLRSTYTVSDYPMLDLDVNASTGVVKFSGTDTNKVDVTKIILTGYTRDAYGYMTDDTYDIEIIKYADQTSDFSVSDLNVSEVFPAGIAAMLEDAIDESTEEKIKVKVYDHRDKSAYEVLDMKVSGDYMGMYLSPKRSLRYSIIRND